MFSANDWVAHHAETRPKRPALHDVSDGTTRTWHELNLRVGRLACALTTRLGLAPGDRVALLANGSARFFELQFACMRAGLVLMPLNFRWTAHEMAVLCEEMDARLLVCDDAWADAAARVAQAANIPRLLSWAGPDSEFDALANEGTPLPPRTDIDLAESTHILFTSGTTGRTKGALTSQGTLLAHALNQVEFAGVAYDDAHVFVPLPLFHAGGLTIANPILYFGGQVTIGPRFDAPFAARFIGDPSNGITHISLVPLMYRMIAETDEFAAADFSAIKVAVSAGGRLPPDLYEIYAAKGLRFSTQYGGTETGPTITAIDAARPDKILEGSCGQKVKHVEIRLVGDDGIDVRKGEAGEVWVKGPAITPGYIGRAADLDFTDGWFRTGDVARRDDEGFYFIVDRKKDMYKSGGENVSSVEVEEILIQHPAIADVGVIGVHHEKWGESGLAVITLKPGATLTLYDVETFCAGRLARFKHPKFLEIMDDMPRNVTGKIAKGALRDMFGGTRSA